jgi:DNA-binding GntR family transcriptional regulator
MVYVNDSKKYLTKTDIYTNFKLISMHDASYMNNKKYDLQRSTTFVDKIYQHIKNLILSRKLKSDQRITVKEFAEYFNVSITPVREALQRLKAEKYISINARSDIRVIGLPADESKKILELNIALDTYGIKKNLKNFPDTLIEELRELHKQYERYYRDKNWKMLFKQSAKIHERIWQAYDNEIIYQTLLNANERFSLFVGSFTDNYYSPHIQKKSYEDHCALMDAIEKRDTKLAAKILANHWNYESIHNTGGIATSDKK